MTDFLYVDAVAGTAKDETGFHGFGKPLGLA